MAPSCASSVPPLIGDYPHCRAAAWQAAPTLPLGLSVAAASLSTEASLPLDMPGGREGLEGATDAQGSARRRSGLAHTSTRRVATPGSQPQKYHVRIAPHRKPCQQFTYGYVRKSYIH